MKKRNNQSPRVRVRREAGRQSQLSGGRFHLKEAQEIESAKIQLLEASQADSPGAGYRLLRRSVPQRSNSNTLLMGSSPLQAKEQEVNGKSQFESWYEPVFKQATRVKYMKNKSIRDLVSESNKIEPDHHKECSCATSTDFYSNSRRQLRTSRYQQSHELMRSKDMEQFTQKIGSRSWQFDRKRRNNSTEEGRPGYKGFLGAIVNIGTNIRVKFPGQMLKMLSCLSDRKNSLRKILIQKADRPKTVGKPQSSLYCSRSIAKQQRNLSKTQYHTQASTSKQKPQRKPSTADNINWGISQSAKITQARTGIAGCAIKRKNKGKWTKPNIKSNISRIYDVNSDSVLKNQIGAIMSLIEQEKMLKESAD